MLQVGEPGPRVTPTVLQWTALGLPGPRVNPYCAPGDSPGLASQTLVPSPTPHLTILSKGVGNV